jgi:ribokinase
MKKILVVGSSNTDMVIIADHFPAPGETIIGGNFLMNPGGKGANQAVAASRLGGNVSFIGKVGLDVFGKEAIQNLKNEGIDVSGIFQDKEYPSGVAQIIVDKHAENTIVVAPGANNNLFVKDIDECNSIIEDSEIILLQLEIPLQTVEYTAQITSSRGKKVILNPAPAAPLSDQLYAYLYMITPNQTEAEFLTGIKVKDEQTAIQAAEFFHKKGVQKVIITLGADGAFLSTKEISKIITSPKVTAVDTTAAGDTFNGALAVALSQNMDEVEAVEFANKAAAQSVTKIGAQSSIPYFAELIENN